jgi:transcriptional regulator with AAA-type ATPase domain
VNAPTISPIEEKLNAFRLSRLSVGLSEESLKMLAEAMNAMSFAAGEVLIEQGEPGRRFHLIVAGRVEVRVRTSAGGTVTSLATLGEGECVGEMSLLTGDVTSAEVVAVAAAQTLTLERTVFDSLLRDHPQLVREFVRIISRRLGTADTAVGAAREEERQLAHFLRDEKAEHYGELIGKHSTLNAVKAQLAKQAPLGSPLLIHGEKGTGKEAVARQIHRQSPRHDGPFLSAECAQISETPWGDKLFGARDAGKAGRRSRSVCYLELAESGTLLLRDVESLPPVLQDRLAHYLEEAATGAAPANPRVRIIASSQRNLQELKATGEITPALATALSIDSLAVPPLRDRKRDIPELADHFVKKYARRMDKPVTGLDDQAIKKLVSYHYRIGNVQELSETIERAVNLADGPLVEAETIFLRPPMAEKSPGFNFLAGSGSLTRRLLRFFPKSIQWMVAAFFAGLLYFCFFGPKEAERNVATVLVWSVWWPALVLSFLLLGRVWCAICPMALAGTTAQKVKNFKWRVPEWLKSHDMLIVGAGFFLIIWVEEVTGMRQSPLATGILLLCIGTGAVVGGILFPRRTWCRHLCPLGGVAGLCSATAMVELRPTFDICAAKCKGHFCFKGDEKTDGCPMFNHVMFVDSNQNCVLCMNCVRSCREGSPQLNLRVPARELWSGAGASAQSAALIAVLMGVVAALVFLQHWEHVPSGWISQMLEEHHFITATLTLLTGGAVPLAGLYVGRRFSRGPADAPVDSKLWRSVLAWTPLVTAGFACYQLGFSPWLQGLHTGFVYNGPGVDGGIGFSVGMLGVTRIALLFFGLVATLSVLWKLSKPELDSTVQIDKLTRILSLTGAVSYWALLMVMVGVVGLAS